MESFFLKIGGWFLALWPAAIGSGLSMFLSPEKVKQLSNLTKFFTFVFGIAIGHNLGGAAIEYWDVIPETWTASSIKISIGFMGIAVLAEAKLQVPLAISAIRKKLLGD